MRSITVARHKTTKEKEQGDVERQPPPDPAVLVRRPPIVTIMGHVDHGKTSLLDQLRHSNIVDQEFGGITQHIGAFSVRLPTGESICFLDTPGHAAFTAMRARGAQLTDIIILVVAADDGVLQQTIESIHHARDAGVPIIVAINKIDKPEADIERTKHMLLEQQLVLEEFGGDVQAVPISALTGANIDLLQEAIVTQAEIMQLKGDPVGLIEGRIVEAKVDSRRGKLATAVIQRGTLKRGTYLVAGTAWAKVRGMFDDTGRPLQEAPPSTPVEILGWKELPSAGDEVLEVTSETTLKRVIDWRQQQTELRKLEQDQVVINEHREEQKQQHREAMRQRREAGFNWARKNPGPRPKEAIIAHEGPQFSLVLKGDVDGSLEAILDTLDTYNSKKCRLDLIHYGVGSITESDVELAEAFKGEIFGFNVEVPAAVSKLALSKQVPIRIHKVIYHLFDDLRKRISSHLPILEEEDVIGEAKVLQVFHVTEGRNKISVAGCRCTKGILNKKKNFKVLRMDEVIYQGEIKSLKHFKVEVESIKMDRECGINVDDPNLEFQVGDVIICYDVREMEQDIDWQPHF
ncbi:translation initiation factor IF-2, mitochondrial-like isoform X2 [Pomacea canaliculata]|nr:translation initiation factor IF-2, mitochondrial-like isoform X2 [Pomacea canaliculata]